MRTRTSSLLIVFMLGICFLCAEEKTKPVSETLSTVETGAQSLKKTVSETAKLLMTEISCDGPLQIDYQNNIATFNDNVIVNDPQLMLKAIKMQVFFDPDSKGIERIVAEGDVRFKKGERQAKADRAEYFSDEGKIVLTGNPMVKQGMNALTGEKITFYRKDSRMTCEPSAKLVVFTQDRAIQDSEWW